MLSIVHTHKKYFIMSLQKIFCFKKIHTYILMIFCPSHIYQALFIILFNIINSKLHHKGVTNTSIYIHTSKNASKNMNDREQKKNMIKVQNIIKSIKHQIKLRMFFAFIFKCTKKNVCATKLHK